MTKRQSAFGACASRFTTTTKEGNAQKNGNG